PLAMLEAAALGLPVVCFAKSGGAVDFVGTDAGRVVSYLDIMGMADALTRLSNYFPTFADFGHKGRTKVLNEYTSKHQAPKLLHLMNDTFATDPIGSRKV